jgi:addiction module HigA family antidote
MIDMITLPNVDASMIANNLTPYEPTHPGQLIRDELEERDMTQAKLAAQIGVSPSLLNEVINGKRAVNTEMALLLEAALGIAAHIWLDLQADYNMQMAKSDTSFMKRLASIRRVAAVL